MKLAMCCVAALSLVACADVETTGGGPTAGKKPDKIQFHPSPSDVPPPEHPVIGELEQIAPAAPATALCDGCTVAAFRLDRGTWGLDEVRVVSLGDTEVCRIYLDQNRAIIDECGVTNP